jgi:threonine dehydrogenase-like Zn-dependent dehydrogenase
MALAGTEEDELISALSTQRCKLPPMQALVVNHASPGAITFVPDHPEPKPTAGEVRIRVRLAGICSTDLEIVRGYMNFTGVPGHEFVGVVDQVPPETVAKASRLSSELLGKRVVAEINCVTPDSTARDEDARKHAWPRSVLGILGRDGAFAEHLAVPAANCHVLPDSISNREAVFVEPLAAAVQVTHDFSFSRDMRIAVLGSGRLGILCAQVLALHVETVDVIGRNERTLGVCRALGLRAIPVSEISPNASYDAIVECTGSADGLRMALKSVRPRGAIILKSTYTTPPEIDLSPVVINEIRVIGSRCGPFAQAIELLAAKRVQVEPLTDGEYPLSRGVEAFAAANTPGALKVLLCAHLH